MEKKPAVILIFGSISFAFAFLLARIDSSFERSGSEIVNPSVDDESPSAPGKYPVAKPSVSNNDSASQMGSAEIFSREYNFEKDHESLSNGLSGEFTELKFEKELMGKRRLPEGEMEDLMMANAMSENISIRELEDQSIGDPEVQSLNNLFRLTGERAISRTGARARIDGLACGTRICVGTLSGGSESEYDKWATEFALSPELAGLGLQTMVTPAKGSGSQALRFAFTIEPYLYLRNMAGS